MYESEQVRDQGLIVEVAHSTLGDISLPVDAPLRFDGSPLRAPAPPPVLGEHADEIRTHFQDSGDRASQHVR